MKIFNVELHISQRTRRDWRHVCEAAAEFIAEMRRPVNVVVFVLCAVTIGFFMLLPWIAE